MSPPPHQGAAVTLARGTLFLARGTNIEPWGTGHPSPGRCEPSPGPPGHLASCWGNSSSLTTDKHLTLGNLMRYCYGVIRWKLAFLVFKFTVRCRAGNTASVARCRVVFTVHGLFFILCLLKVEGVLCYKMKIRPFQHSTV